MPAAGILAAFWGGRGMGRLGLHEREAVRALWRGQFEAWRLSSANIAIGMAYR